MSNITSITAKVDRESAGKDKWCADAGTTECGTGIRIHDFRHAEHAEVTLTHTGPFTSCDITEGNEGRILYLMADCIKDGLAKLGSTKSTADVLASALAYSVGIECDDAESASEVLQIVAENLAESVGCTTAEVKKGGKRMPLIESIKNTVDAILEARDSRIECKSV